MARYIVRRLITLLITMLVVSMVVFALVEVAPGNVVRNILGNLATPAQERSVAKQLGLDRPPVVRYISWLLGSDWQAERVIGMPLQTTTTSQGTVKDYTQWWAVTPNGQLSQWTMEGDHLYQLIRQPDGSVKRVLDDRAWRDDGHGNKYFWGVDTNNHAAKWVQGQGDIEYRQSYAGMQQSSGAPVDYIPLGRGILRGDAGTSLMYNRPVSDVIGGRIKNSAILAGLALLVCMPLAVLLGLIAGLNRGRMLDRVISLLGLVTTASPDFATGIMLIMVFALWLKWLPGATVFSSGRGLLADPRMIIMPVLTIALVEMGYVLRITRASVMDVVNSPYVRTAMLKGIPYSQVVLRHVLRNALMAPVTVIMLHVNWLIGGLVVVESVFGYPGLGSFLMQAALQKDVASVEAGSLVLITLAVGSQLIADIVYAFLNPRIRYS